MCGCWCGGCKIHFCEKVHARPHNCCSTHKSWHGRGVLNKIVSNMLNRISPDTKRCYFTDAFLSAIVAATAIFNWTLRLVLHYTFTTDSSLKSKSQRTKATLTQSCEGRELSGGGRAETRSKQSSVFWLTTTRHESNIIFYELTWFSVDFR